MHKKKTWRGDVAALSMVKMVPKSMKEPKAEEEFDVVCVCVFFFGQERFRQLSAENRQHFCSSSTVEVLKRGLFRVRSFNG